MVDAVVDHVFGPAVCGTIFPAMVLALEGVTLLAGLTTGFDTGFLVAAAGALTAFFVDGFRAVFDIGVCDCGLTCVGRAATLLAAGAFETVPGTAFTTDGLADTFRETGRRMGVVFLIGTLRMMGDLERILGAEAVFTAGVFTEVTVGAARLALPLL